MLISSHQTPSWARAGVERLQEAARARQSGEQPDPELVSESVDAEDATVRLWRQRDQFIDIRNWDELPGSDQALDEPGRVVNSSGTDFRYSGGFLKGELSLVTGDDQVFQRLTCDGATTTSVFVNQDGYGRISHYDLAHPEKSYQISTAPDAVLDIPDSPYAGAVVSAAEILGQIPEGTPERLMTSVFMDGKVSMTDAREQFQATLWSGLQKLEKEGLDTASVRGSLQKQNGTTAQRVYKALRDLQKAHPENGTLRELRDTTGMWQILEDFPKLQADGLTRAAEFYVGPAHLQSATMAQGWEVDQQSGLPIADSIVVGAGPGGLASAYHLSERGKRTVVFEAGHAGQGFSDANAKSVHQMRTNGDASSVIYLGGPAQLGVDVSMPRHLSKTRGQAALAREAWEQASGERFQGISKADAGDRGNAANRGELFAHLSQVAMGLAQHYPDTFLCERSPVEAIEKVQRGEETLFKVTTGQGHQMMTRSLVMATGFVGGHGEHARCLKQFSELESSGRSTTVLCNDHDLVAKNEQMDEALENLRDQRTVSRNFVLSERLLGRPEVRTLIKGLPEGSRIAVIGGGESATKGALEALSLNAGISLDLYTSKPLEPYQTQIPTSVISPPVVEKSISEPEVARRTLESLEDFETPVTPATLESLLEMEQAGRVRIREMGARFNEKTVQVTESEDADGKTLALKLADPEVGQRLKAQRQDWTAAGLYGSNPPAEPAEELPTADMVIVAAGYDRRSLRAGPLITQLIDQGLVSLKDGEPVLGEDGLTSANNPMIAFNTAGAASQAADSAIPGRAIRGLRLAEVFEERLPQRDKPVDRIADKLPYGQVDTSTPRDNFRWETPRVHQLIDNGGFSPDYIQDKEETIASLEDPAERKLYEAWWQAEKRFSFVNSPIRALVARAEEVPSALTPVEKIMVSRADQLSRRITPEHHAKRS